tara:strand:- start:2743 stop:3762 length:1020 start_codon:yes stop_codon:yes gene_type:complete
MILNRYFLKSIFSYTASVSVIFLLIIVSSRSIQYLDQAARGEINPEVVFWIILFRLPEFCQIILPLSFFISIVLSIGKLRSESEFIVMEQNGFSFKRLHTLLISFGTLICVLIFSLSAWLTPKFELQISNMLQQKTLKEKIIAITPGEFHRINESILVFAKESSNNNLTKVFIKNKSKDNLASEVFILANKAYAEGAEEETMQMNDGNIYFFEESDNFSKLSFEIMNLKVSLESNKRNKNAEGLNALSSSNISWILSLCALTLISIFLAVPLSTINPREGRYKRVLPALLIFSLYLGLLIASRGASLLSSLNQINSMVLIHLLFVLLAIYFYQRAKFKI